MTGNEEILNPKNEFEDLLTGIDDEFQENLQEEVYDKPDYFITASTKSRKLNRDLGRLQMRGIPLNVAIIVLATIAVASFGFFVGLYLINSYSDTTKLVAEIDGMEKLYYEVRKLSSVRNETVQSLKTRTDTENVLSMLNLSQKKSEYKNVTRTGSSEEMVALLQKIIDDNRIIIDRLELNSNLGFPILPETNLPNNIIVNLELDLSVVNNLF